MVTVEAEAVLRVLATVGWPLGRGADCADWRKADARGSWEGLPGIIQGFSQYESR